MEGRDVLSWLREGNPGWFHILPALRQGCYGGTSATKSDQSRGFQWSALGRGFVCHPAPYRRSGIGYGVLVWLASSSLEPAENDMGSCFAEVDERPDRSPGGEVLLCEVSCQARLDAQRPRGWEFPYLGRSGNDIQSVLAEESEWENWINGHNARLLYSTQKTTNGKLDVPIAEEGTYYLGFNNAFSIMSDEYVFAEIELPYDRSN